MSSKRASALTDDKVAELRAAFDTVDKDGSGEIDAEELQMALKESGIILARHKVRDMIVNCDVNDDGKLRFDEFLNIFAELDKESVGKQFKKSITSRTDLTTHGGSSEASVEGTTHSITDAEQVAFTDWINRNLANDPDCKKDLPIGRNDLYKKLRNGIMLCKLINQAVPDTVDERVLNKTGLDQSIYKRAENQVLALNSARSIGCTIVNIGPEDIDNCKPYLVLGLLWQVIRIGLLSEVNLTNHPGLVALLREGETPEDLLRMSPEQILLRWVNYQLDRAGCNRQINNFTDDIKDSEAYTYLLKQIAPKEKGVTLFPLNTNNLEQRAEEMLQEADKLDCRSFVGPKDVVSGNPRLNLAFVATLFNNYPALDNVESEEFEIIEETREEKTYRNWMNSLGVTPSVYHLYGDLCDGLVYFQLYDIIKKGSVDWAKVNKKFSRIKKNFEMLENGNYAVELGKKASFSLVGVGGQDLVEGNRTLTLALVWQLMRAYTLTVLNELQDHQGSQIKDVDICKWAHKKVQEAGKSWPLLNSFQDPILRDGLYILDVIEAIKPVAVDRKIVKTGNNLSEEDMLSNAKYAVSLARKIGARVYALPEDIVEGKYKMIMTIFACLMYRDIKDRRSQAEQN